MNIRYANEKDTNGIKNLWSYCFGDGESFINYYFNNKYDFKNTILIEDEDQTGEILSALQLNKYTIKLKENNYNVSYIVGVSSKPEVRGFGYMKNLITHTLKELYNRGELVSILMAIDYRLYKRYGFEHCYDQLQYNINTEDLSKFKLDNRLKKATIDDAKFLSKCYMKSMENLNGYAIRDEAYFTNFIKEIECEDGHVYLSNEGYIAYYIQGDTIYVREIIYNDINSLKSMLGFIYNHNTQCKKTIINAAVNDKFRFLIENLKTAEIKVIPFMAGRVINVIKYLESIDISKYTLDDINNKSIKIKIIDKFIDENNGVFEISVDENKVKVVKTDGKEDIELSIQSITQLSFSYLSVEEIFMLNNIDYDLLSEGQKQILQILFNKKINYIDELV